MREFGLGRGGSIARLTKPPAIVGLSILLAVGGCGTSGTTPEGASPDGGANVTPNGEDVVLAGRWEHIYSGENGDFPNVDPRVDSDGILAHFVYVAKAGNLRYFTFNDGGGKTEIPLPQGTKNPGRIALQASRAVILTREPVNGDTGTLFATGTSAIPGAPPFPPKQSGGELSVARIGSDVIAATRVVAGGESVHVSRLVGDTWNAAGTFPSSGPIVQVELDSDGDAAALLTFEGASARHVRVLRGTAWEELGAPEYSGVIGSVFVALDGPRLNLVEYHQEESRSVVYRNEGGKWSELARSDVGEAFHGLEVHAGGLYTFTSDLPNGSSLTTRGIARIDAGKVTRKGFDTQGPTPNMSPEARADVMSHAKSHIVSRGSALFMAYQELGTPTIIHLLKWKAN